MGLLQYTATLLWSNGQPTSFSTPPHYWAVVAQQGNLSPRPVKEIHYPLLPGTMVVY